MFTLVNIYLKHITYQAFKDHKTYIKTFFFLKKMLWNQSAVVSRTLITWGMLNALFMRICIPSHFWNKNQVFIIFKSPLSILRFSQEKQRQGFSKNTII